MLGAARINGEVIGIDLGTTFSCVAVVRPGLGVQVIANDQGNRTTPSYVAFSPSNAGSKRLVGEAAKNQATLNPRRTVFDVKRLIGKKFDDPDVRAYLKYSPYPVVRRHGKPCVEIEVNGKLKTFTPEEISAMLLRKMKETAETYLGKKVTNAVVTVPAYFNIFQRQATKDAGTIAGLNVVRILNEPTAAALAYGVNKGSTTNKKHVLVFDLGGGTLDVSILNINNDVYQVLATGGDMHLGGVDFDQRVMNYFVNLIRRKYRIDITSDGKALAKLRKECERAKRVLSTQKHTRVEIDSLILGMYFSEPLSRARFENLNSDLFEKTMKVVRSTLKDANLLKGKIDEIVLVGGSTGIPKVREMLKEEFDGKEPSIGINPDEVVACGAAVQGAMLSSDQDGLVVTLNDVTPLSLGIRTMGGVMSVVVPRNTVIPTKKKCRGYTTVEDQQTTIVFEVFQGERALTKGCILLGSFTLSGIPPAPRGVASVEVTMEVDADGILSVTAKDEATGNSKSLAINNSKRNLSSMEIERMTREARRMAEHDRKEKARIDPRNQLERNIYDLNYGKTALERALGEASGWLDHNRDACKQDYEAKSQELADLVAKMIVGWNRPPV
ncbi:unnamed protein product [Linum trigynum]|uniref:Uncharacterized protein n=1 Tax=Linum trigynum TaxID=586398 RepID=A0AAV2F2P4_9ROSI